MRGEMTEQESEILMLCRNAESRNKGFALLVNHYQKQVYAQIKRMILDHDDTSDVMQNTFIKIFNGLDSFRGESKLSSWIFRIAANETLNFLQSKKRRFGFFSINDNAYLNQTLKSPEYVDYDEFELKFQKAILTLPQKQRQVFTMKFYEDYTFDQLAEILNQTAGGLKASYHHATKKIEKYLEDN